MASSDRGPSWMLGSKQQAVIKFGTKARVFRKTRLDPALAFTVYPS